jgi:Rib/alpha/Esp surface antigen-like repeat protein
MSFYIKQNDTVPSLRAALENGSGTAVDLTGATCQFHMRPLGSTTITVDAVAQIVNEATGIVQYNWIAADTDTIGSYQAEFEVTYPDGTIETFPNNGYIRVEITDDIT